MEQNYQYHLPEKKPANNKPPSRLGLRATTGAGAGGGEIVEVEGGHIVRSTGRKDRHSKVCTAKGPRDRRVRLSAHTAIQFYDVQDRLGYDRPSKAVDWLIKKAKASIDELAELPAWKPTNGSTPVNLEHDRNLEKFNYHRLSRFDEHHDEDIGNNNMGHDQNSSFLPTGLDSVKSFFPASGSSESHDFNQDLKLSLHSFQPEQSNNIYFDGGGGSTWPENSGFSGFVFNSPSPSPATVTMTQTTPFLQPLFGQPTNNHLFNYISQRGPLQSSNNTPPVRAWVDPHPPPPPFSGGGVEQHPTLAFHHSPFVPGFTPGFGGLSGFHIPTRIQGDEEEHDGISDKPSSASSDSRH